MRRFKVDREFSIHTFCTAFDFHWRANFVFEGESHDFWEIVYVMFGSVEVTENEQVYRLSEGNMVLHEPLEFHKIRSVGDSSPRVLIISFEHTGQLPSQLGEGVFFLSENERKEYETLFELIYSLRHNSAVDGYVGQECADALSTFLIRLSRNHIVKEQLCSTYDTIMYRKLVEVLEENLYHNLTLEEVAQKVPISVSTMKILFKRYAGISPKAYYDRLRCTEAIRLLQSGLSAAETSEQMEFSSPNYFSVFFKRMTGYPPASYLKIINGRSNIEP